MNPKARAKEGSNPTRKGVVWGTRTRLEQLRQRFGCLPEETLNMTITLFYRWWDGLPPDQWDVVFRTMRLSFERDQRGEGSDDVINRMLDELHKR